MCILAVPMAISFTMDQFDTIRVKHIPAIILFSIFPVINGIFAFLTLIGIFASINGKISEFTQINFLNLLNFGIKN